MRDITIWAINLGRNAEAESLFLSKSIISPGLGKMPDLSYAGDREAFKIRYQQSYPGTQSSDIPVVAAQIFRFVQEIGDGDFVVFPAKLSRKIHIGQITGHYTYRPSVSPIFPHQRPVRWLKELSRAQFSQGALFELGSTLMVFKIKAYAEEFRASLERKLTSPDEKIIPSAPVASEEVEEQTRDFVARQMLQSPRAHFENLIVQVIEKLGYRMLPVSTSSTASGFVAYKGLVGFESPALKVHLCLDGKISEPDWATFIKKVGPSESGLIISAGSFPASIWRSAEDYPNLQLIDGAELAELVFRLYDQLGLQQRQMIPLKRIFVPDIGTNDSAE
jgi:restriction system protein